MNLGKLSKPIKCHFCKQVIEGEPVEVNTGVKNIVIKKAHQNCKNNYVQRKEFFEYVIKTLDILKIQDKNFIVNVNQFAKDYGWNVVRDAFEVKEQAIKDNFKIGWRYITAILRNQLDISYRDLIVGTKELVGEDPNRADTFEFMVNNHNVRPKSRDITKIFDDLK